MNVSGLRVDVSLGPLVARGLVARVPHDMADERTLPELLGDLYVQVTTLVRQEILLAKTEIYDTISGLARAAALVAAGALLLSSGIVVLVGASVLIISRFFGIGLWLSALIVAAFVAAAGMVLVKAGLSRLRGTLVVPTQTLAKAKEDVTWLREHAK